MSLFLFLIHGNCKNKQTNNKTKTKHLPFGPENLKATLLTYIIVSHNKCSIIIIYVFKIHQTNSLHIIFPYYIHIHLPLFLFLGKYNLSIPFLIWSSFLLLTWPNQLCLQLLLSSKSLSDLIILILSCYTQGESEYL